jgi:predicted nuclease of predicted toxin-antitoxin system
LLFLIDAQLPVSLADALRQAACEALHVADLDLAMATDRRIWEEAVARTATLITKDRDFALLRAANKDGPTIVWIRVGNIDNKTLIAQILLSLPRIQSAIESGETIIEFVGR